MQDLPLTQHLADFFSNLIRERYFPGYCIQSSHVVFKEAQIHSSLCNFGIDYMKFHRPKDIFDSDQFTVHLTVIDEQTFERKVISAKELMKKFGLNKEFPEVYNGL